MDVDIFGEIDILLTMNEYDVMKKVRETAFELPMQAALNYLQSCENHGGMLGECAKIIRLERQATLEFEI